MNLWRVIFFLWSHVMTFSTISMSIWLYATLTLKQSVSVRAKRGSVLLSAPLLHLFPPFPIAPSSAGTRNSAADAHACILGRIKTCTRDDEAHSYLTRRGDSTLLYMNFLLVIKPIINRKPMAPGSMYHRYKPRGHKTPRKKAQHHDLVVSLRLKSQRKTTKSAQPQCNFNKIKE